MPGRFDRSENSSCTQKGRWSSRGGGRMDTMGRGHVQGSRWASKEGTSARGRTGGSLRWAWRNGGQVVKTGGPARLAQPAARREGVQMSVSRIICRGQEMCPGRHACRRDVRPPVVRIDWIGCRQTAELAQRHQLRLARVLAALASSGGSQLRSSRAQEGHRLCRGSQATRDGWVSSLASLASRTAASSHPHWL